jgi:hypothetical protein
MEASEEFGKHFARIPLEKGAEIRCANAHRIDWEELVSKNELSYILGNPPFVGHQWRNAEQQEDMRLVYKDAKNHGKLDYVCAWYQRAAEYMQGSSAKTAFVSTNSIVQGESVSTLWKPLFEQGYEIGFAYSPFVWSNEAKDKAAVHCVIVGFEPVGNTKTKRLYGQDTVTETNNINGYLLAAPSVFIQSRGKPLTKGMPEMSKGSQPTDGGNLILSLEEKNELIAHCPQAAQWIRQYIGSEEFINGNLRYCLWLKGVAPTEYRTIKPIMERVKKVADMRSASPTASVKRDAETPMLFTQIRQPETRYLVVPEVSSERRKYIPIGYLEPNVVASNKLYIVPEATLFMFGILTSNIHNAWMRVVAGRLEMRYSYSPAVYNNFPWPEATNKQKAEIEKLAQGILDARALFPQSSLADLYDPLTMPPELLKAHHALDRAVIKLYGFAKDILEPVIVATLFERYKELS